MIYYGLLLFHIIAALILILVVLLQSGKAGDLASAFGGSASQTAFGARGGATMLSKATTIAAVVFMVTSLGLSITSTDDHESIVPEAPIPLTDQAQPVSEDTEPVASPEEPDSPGGTEGSGETSPPPSQEGSGTEGQGGSSQDGT
ncbi:MAG TPA: preprotein translocase subunit SecG [Acidobacteriota bacterium]|nr:preprotein translocase subunit SecG [Acidobacteriota bacterium]